MNRAVAAYSTLLFSSLFSEQRAAAGDGAGTPAVAARTAIRLLHQFALHISISRAEQLRFATSTATAGLASIIEGPVPPLALLPRQNSMPFVLIAKYLAQER
jgi:hypothetical protein